MASEVEGKSDVWLSSKVEKISLVIRVNNAHKLKFTAQMCTVVGKSGNPVYEILFRMKTTHLLLC